MAVHNGTRTRILVIGGVDVEQEPNHRFFHVVDFLAAHYDEVVFVSTANLYGGPPIGFAQKMLKSFMNVLTDRRKEYRQQNVHHIIVRKLKLPMFLQNLAGDLWIYTVLPGWLKKERFETCIYSFPQTAFVTGLLRRRGVAKKLVYDDCDYFPAHLDAAGKLSAAALTWKERRAATQADGVISVSTPLAALRREQGVKNVIVIPNGVVLDNLTGARQKEPHPPTLLYIGMLSEAWGVDLMLDALPLVREAIPDVHFVIVGDGDYREALEEKARALGLENSVSFCGRKPHSELISYIRQADVGVALYKQREFIHYASPMKVREYMAAGLPVLTTRIGQAEEVIEESNAGELVERTPEAIAAAAIKLLKDDDLRAQYAENAVRYTENADWNSVLEPVLDFINTV
ncbi:MAG TPA: glycosyltransferase family 4 protein [Aggregatilinea sp.]|uniref:glycosyltransferase family 4 protein n=1 Tax=Aggregatilinea sp. TaxID=2806333 RepID=UPI002C3E25C5|nr:glycosyltransferase family 4 protein [Aggregatilinea sp.]HML20747.1 glycosyltransferase family 4 protein [Aggregatilinea sp.]